MTRFTEEQKQFILDNYATMQTWQIAEKLNLPKKKIEGFAYYHHLKKAENFKVIRIDNRFDFDECDYIIENFHNKTNSQIAAYLGCTTDEVAAFARAHRLKKSCVAYMGNGTMSAEQKQFILDNYATMLTSDISKKIGVEPNRIRSYAYAHGVKRDREVAPVMVDNKDGLSIEQKKYIIENYAFMQNNDICDAISITPEQLHSYSSNRKLSKNVGAGMKDDGYFDVCINERNNNEYNIETHLGQSCEPKIAQEYLYKSKYGKYFVNQSYFETIDNEWKAYWLGFLYADGYVINQKRNGKSENCVGLTLSIKDKNHVQKFLNSLQSDSPVALYKTNYKDYMCAKSYITNQKLVQDLCKCGCVPNKSLILTFPTFDIVPQHLLRHFIRGYFDGDGCVSINKESCSVIINFLGTKEFLSKLQDILFETCGLRKTKIQQKRGSKAYYIEYGYIYAIKKFYNYLYKDCNIYLERKLNKFDTVFCLE